MSISEQYDIAYFVERMLAGTLLLYPSDTVWSLGCDATNERACQQIANLKQRSSQKSFIVLMDGFSMLNRYVPHFDPICYDLIRQANAPLTIVYPHAVHLAPSVVASDGSVGIRITKDPLCVELIQSINRPIVSTSANISGESIPKNYTQISEHIKNGVDLTLATDITKNMEKVSTIIRINHQGQIEYIRK